MEYQNGKWSKTLTRILRLNFRKLGGKEGQSIDDLADTIKTGKTPIKHLNRSLNLWDKCLVSQNIGDGTNFQELVMV